MLFEQDFNATRTGNVKFQFCSLAQFPAPQHVDAVAIKEQGDVFPHVFPPVCVLRYAVFKGVHRLVAFYGEMER